MNSRHNWGLMSARTRTEALAAVWCRGFTARAGAVRCWLTRRSSIVGIAVLVIAVADVWWGWRSQGRLGRAGRRVVFCVYAVRAADGRGGAAGTLCFAAGSRGSRWRSG